VVNLSSRLAFCYGVVLSSYAALLSGCAASGVSETQVYDPWESFNRRSYSVMDAADRYAVRPAARVYASLLPDALQSGVLNFFANLRAPMSALCGFLEGKPARGGKDLARFVINSTLGVGGLFDVARRAGIDFQDEDPGQVLAVWGYRRSRALFLPLVGPTTVRDLPGDILNLILVPSWWLGDAYGWATATTDSLATRATLLDATDARDAAALDSYAFTREASHQRRLALIYDGSPPVEDFLDEGDDVER
jgi:phospholipid-binding lipoprotein MlaA